MTSGKKSTSNSKKNSSSSNKSSSSNQNTRPTNISSFQDHSRHEEAGHCGTEGRSGHCS